MKIKGSIEIRKYRDGGSLGITFEEAGSENVANELFLKIKNVGSNIFRSARLITRVRTNYICPMTGASIPDIQKTEKSLDLIEAEFALSKLIKASIGENASLKGRLEKIRSEIIMSAQQSDASETMT
ncbi:MAG: hypothetical protein ACK5PQ_00050 [Alphaproteobacteria bacterium]